MSRRSMLFLLAASAAAALCLLAWRTSAQGSLQTSYFLTGWLATLPVVVLALAWWIGGLDDAGLARRLRTQLWLGLVLVVLYAAHVELRVPNGVMETTLSLLFGATLVSTVGGFAMVGTGSFQRRWAIAHVALVHGLLSLTVVHGVLMHFHGALAALVATVGGD